MKPGFSVLPHALARAAFFGECWSLHFRVLEKQVEIAKLANSFLIARFNALVFVEWEPGGCNQGPLALPSKPIGSWFPSTGKS